MSIEALVRDLANDEIDDIVRAMRSSDITFDQRQEALVRQMCLQSWLSGLEFRHKLTAAVKRVRG